MSKTKLADDAVPAPSVTSRRAAIGRHLAGRRLPWIAALIGFVLVSPTITAPFFADDLLQQLRAARKHVSWRPLAAWLGISIGSPTAARV